MFDKVLIANRGEIAVRIIHACREMGIPSVAVFSEADREALHVQLADEAVCIGPAAAKDSYLNIQSILAACAVTGANAIHPGFGFLSENSSFAHTCRRCGVTFIGPSAESMEQMGDKATARETMKRAGVPVIPGSDGLITDLEQAKELARSIGYPVMVKATSGGGGRGIRKVDTPDQLEGAVAAARAEAAACFGNDGVYLEKYIVNPRHIEFQILADSYGNTVHLGERDCSLQRRNQKMIEESPSPAVDSALRERMGEAAVSAAKACNYQNAGTVEFLLDADNRFYFMEMNTRVQVEHGITELVTGIDIVKNQILIAKGMPLSFAQQDVVLRGHAMECRVNAENPERGFAPSPGKIHSLFLPCGNGIRVDSAVYSGYTIPPYYDSMIAKVMAYAPDRREVIQKLKWALAEFLVDGIDTNIDFQLSLLREKDFEEGRFDIGYLQRKGY